MITTMLCYSATSVAYVTVYGTPGRVDMGNVGLETRLYRWVVLAKSRTCTFTYEARLRGKS